MYNHNNNAGSVSDIFKHAVLLKAAERKKPKTYFETHCGFSSYKKPEIWESSWAKVHRTGATHMILCDINHLVGNTVPSYDEFEFICADGFIEGLKSTADLTFIDPPYVDDSDWLDVSILCSKIKNWIVWYPIFVTGQRLEPEPVCIEMIWQTTKNMVGCGMAFSKEFTKYDLRYIYKCVPFIAWSLSACEWTIKGV
jgi:23S rRNA A2030 N6-methylase RlmJ